MVAPPLADCFLWFLATTTLTMPARKTDNVKWPLIENLNEKERQPDEQIVYATQGFLNLQHAEKGG